jgi:glyoxylase I family protein
MTEVIGIDHIYVTVNCLETSASFYDLVMPSLGFRKNTFKIKDDSHIQYYNRHFGYVLRPALTDSLHNPYQSGLHHLCFRVIEPEDVFNVAKMLLEKGIACSEPKRYAEYADRLEVTNFRNERIERFKNWDTQPS